jgi:hypothetical protein
MDENSNSEFIDPAAIAGGHGGDAPRTDRAMGSESEPKSGTESQAGSGTGGAPESGTGSPRKRGRPPGSRNKSRAGGEQRKPATAGAPAPTRAPLDLNGLEKILYSLHAMAAAKIAPELQLSESEAAAMAAAIGAVAEHYDLTIDPKTQAWVQLGFIVFAVYGPRAVAIAQRTRHAPVRLHTINPAGDDDATTG